MKVTRTVRRDKLLEEQTTIRRTLLENGYSPLPAREKVVTMKGWPKIVATEEEIENWKLSSAFCTTAIRIEGDLVAIDVDIDDEATDDLCDLLEAAVPALRKAPLRWGKGDKRMYLLRCEEQPGIIASHVFMRGGDENDRHRLEIFGGGTTRYFTCFGPHTEGETTAEGVEIAVEYEWVGASPLDTRPETLPSISMGDILRLTDIANEWISERGWEKTQRSVSGKVGSEPVFDLTEGMVFECSDGVDRTLQDLRDMRRIGANMRCSASWHEPGARNRSRCLIEKHHDGEPKVFDFDEYRWHLPENADRRSLGEKRKDEAVGATSALGEALLGAGYTASDIVGELLSGEFEAQVEGLLENWAWMPGPGSGHAVHLSDVVREKLTIPSFRMAYAHMYTFGEPGPKGGKPKKYHATDVWALADQRVTVEGFRYKPGIADRLIEEDGHKWLNNYMPPALAEVGQWLDIWIDLAAHLLPDEEERGWFHNWMAWKTQNPGSRGAAIVFVSEGVQGTGRGTLFKILRAVFGSSNVADVAFGKLVGSHGQSQFDEWRLDKVLVVCNEASSSEGRHHSGAQRKQYDALKDIVDPASSKVTVNVKGEKTRTDQTYISLMIASNYSDALPIDVNDRRFAVLTTPNKLEDNPKLFNTLFTEIIPEGGDVDPRFARAIVDFYRGMNAVQEDFYTALHTEAKEEMAELAEGPVERMARDVFSKMPVQDYVSSSTLCTKVEAALNQRNLAKMTGHVRAAVMTTLQNMKYVKVGRRRINGVRHIIYARPGVNPALFDDLDEGEKLAQVSA